MQIVGGDFRGEFKNYSDLTSRNRGRCVRQPLMAYFKGTQVLLPLSAARTVNYRSSIVFLLVIVARLLLFRAKNGPRGARPNETGTVRYLRRVVAVARLLRLAI